VLHAKQSGEKAGTGMEEVRSVSSRIDVEKPSLIDIPPTLIIAESTEIWTPTRKAAQHSSAHRYK
jgi:hypothetical protein